MRVLGEQEQTLVDFGVERVRPRLEVPDPVPELSEPGPVVVVRGGRGLCRLGDTMSAPVPFGPEAVRLLPDRPSFAVERQEMVDLGRVAPSGPEARLERVRGFPHVADGIHGREPNPDPRHNPSRGTNAAFGTTVPLERNLYRARRRSVLEERG